MIPLAIPEYHSAMERGVVDGVVTSLPVGMQFGIHEVSKAIIVPGFYRSTVALPVNLEKWNSLPEHLQKILTEAISEFEKEFTLYEGEERAAALKRIEQGGAETVKLAPDVEKWFQGAAREGVWKDAQKRFPGDLIPNLRKRITKP